MDLVIYLHVMVITMTLKGGIQGEVKQTNHDGGIQRRSTDSISPYYCDDGWFVEGSSCYLVSTQTLTWQSARDECINVGGYLADVHDAEENSVLGGKAIELRESLWIGLTDRTSEGVWIWENTGDLLNDNVKYTNWGPGEPNDNKGAEDCALYSPSHSYEWNDISCETQCGFICKKEAIDVDECTDGTHNCNENAECENLNGGFNCTCKPGFNGDGNSCSDVDECSDRIHDCDVNAECENNNGGFNCLCNIGYRGDGNNCTDVDECTDGTHNCNENAECENLNGGFNCTCKPGFNGDGNSCSDVDECSDRIHDCDVNAECENNNGGFNCSCNTGYRGDGNNCTDICTPTYADTADIVFLLDVSLSQSNVSFEKQKTFVKDFVREFPIGPNNFQMALVTSSYDPTVHFFLDTYTDVKAIHDVLDTLSLEKGPTNTGKGIKTIKDTVLNTSNGARNDVTKYVIVLSDGLSSNPLDTRTQAELIKTSGVETIAVAAGREIYHQELIDVTDHVSKIFPAIGRDVHNMVLSNQLKEECTKCYRGTSDLALMVDASSDIFFLTYIKQLQSLSILMKALPVSNDGVHISCAQYADNVDNEFHFTDTRTPSDIIIRLNKMQKLDTPSNPKHALEYLRTVGFSMESGARNGTRKVAIFILNKDEIGEDVLEEAELLKESGVTLVIITFGIKNDREPILQMASDALFVFTLGEKTYIDDAVLHSLIGTLEYNTCNLD